MANRHRGEVEAVIGGSRHTLCLTLGALAELEDVFGVEDLVALAGRFESGRLSARDITRILAAGLKGSGDPLTAEELAALPIEGGAAGAARIVSDLLTATFGAPDGQGAPKNPQMPRSA